MLLRRLQPISITPPSRLITATGAPRLVSGERTVHVESTKARPVHAGLGGTVPGRVEFEVSLGLLSLRGWFQVDGSGLKQARSCLDV